jgi:stage V sporulation protein G
MRLQRGQGRVIERALHPRPVPEDGAGHEPAEPQGWLRGEYLMVEITEVRVSLRNDDKLKAFVSITLNDSFVVRGLKIIRGNSGLFVAMPSRKRPDGQHQDLAHPINDVTRKYLTEKVMAEYERELAHPTAHPHSNNEEQHAY